MSRVFIATFRRQSKENSLSTPKGAQHIGHLFRAEASGFKSKRPVTMFGPATELGEVLEIIPEISPELALELSDYGADGNNLG